MVFSLLSLDTWLLTPTKISRLRSKWHPNSQHETRNSKLPTSDFGLPTTHQTKSIFYGLFTPDSWFLVLGSSLNKVIDTFFDSFFENPPKNTRTDILTWNLKPLTLNSRLRTSDSRTLNCQQNLHRLEQFTGQWTNHAFHFHLHQSGRYLKNGQFALQSHGVQ